MKIIFKGKKISVSDYFLLFDDEVIFLDASSIPNIVFQDKLFAIKNLLYSENYRILDKFFITLENTYGKFEGIQIEFCKSISKELLKYLEKNKTTILDEDKFAMSYFRYKKDKKIDDSEFLYNLVVKNIRKEIVAINNLATGSIEKRDIRNIDRILSLILSDLFLEESISMLKIPYIDKISNQCNHLKLKMFTVDELERIFLINTIVNNKVIGLETKYKFYEEYKVAVVSPFSFGKSTILNALIGKEILKTDLRAETAIITKVMNNKNKSFIIKRNTDVIEEYFYKNDKDLVQKLKKITSVHGKGNSIKEVALNYSYKNLQNITLIDSPGLFSRYNHHDKLGLDSIDIADLVMFIVDPIKIGEKNFSEVMNDAIKKLVKKGKHFCFILSKLDMYEEDKERLLEEFNIVLEEIDGKLGELIFVSGYFAILGNKLRDDEISVDEIRKNRDVYILDDEDFITGKGIEKKHYKNLLEFSNINELIDSINNYKEKYSC